MLYNFGAVGGAGPQLRGTTDPQEAVAPLCEWASLQVCQLGELVELCVPVTVVLGLCAFSALIGALLLCLCWKWSSCCRPTTPSRGPAPVRQGSPWSPTKDGRTSGPAPRSSRATDPAAASALHDMGPRHDTVRQLRRGRGTLA